MASLPTPEKKNKTFCAVCNEEIPDNQDTGLKCTSAHTLCCTCSASYVAVLLAGDDPATSLMSKTFIPCSICKAPVVPESFERQLDNEQVAQYLSWRMMQNMAVEGGGVVHSCTHCPYFAVVDAHLETFYCQNNYRRVAHSSASRPHVVWVRNLPKGTTESEARALAGVTAISADVGAPSGSPTASAWIAFKTAAHAAAAVRAIHGRAQAPPAENMRAVLSGTETEDEKHVECLRAHCGVCLRDITRMTESDALLTEEAYELKLTAPGSGPATHFECHELAPFKLIVEKAVHESTGQLCPWGCGLLATKDDACSHITCTKCERKWCYFCARKITECPGATPETNYYGTHNEDFVTDPTHCPLFFYLINDEANDAAWPEDNEGANAHFLRILALRRMKALFPVLGAAVMAASRVPGAKHAFVTAAIAGGATPTIAGARMYEALHSRYNFGYTHAEIDAFNIAAPIIVPGRRAV